MIKLTNAVFNNVMFIETVKKVYNSDLNAKDALRLHKMIKKLDEYGKEYDEIKMKILKSTAIPDPKNESQWKFETEEKAQAFADQFNELLSEEFTLEFNKIQVPIDSVLTLKASEIDILDDIIDFIDTEVEQEETDEETLEIV